jgi:hypothetical protein
LGNAPRASEVSEAQVGPSGGTKFQPHFKNPPLRISAFRYYFYCNDLATEVSAFFGGRIIPFFLEAGGGPIVPGVRGYEWRNNASRIEAS